MKSYSSFLCLWFAFALSGAAGAQTIDLFGGYSAARVRPEQNFDRAVMNGWNSSITKWTGPRFGLAADFAGYYGSLNPTSTSTNGSGSTLLPSVTARQHSFMGGPQFRLIHTDKIDTSVKALFGAAHGSVSEPSALPGGATLSSPNDTAFASFIGSNFDVNVSRRMALRFSPGLYLTEFNGETQKSFRFSVGPVFRLGGER
jgi:hypothetical protein